VAHSFQDGSGRLYAPRFLKDLRKKALDHARLNGNGVDVGRIANLQTMREFDNLFTAPMHGFRDADDYYKKNSCGQFLPGIRVPTLVIRAMDDPFFASDIPHTALVQNEFLFPGLVAHGGHVAFAEGIWPDRFRYWAERQAARFLAANLLEANG
jgi:predicted alpha/beta-fold hydrolase